MDMLAGYANKLGVYRQRFHACVKSKFIRPEFRADSDEANSVGITRTPSFVNGRTSGDAVEGENVIGALSYNALQKIFSDYTIHRFITSVERRIRVIRKADFNNAENSEDHLSANH
jgi:predicted DsbA family dithiol-disulfide isomerase